MRTPGSTSTQSDASGPEPKAAHPHELTAEHTMTADPTPQRDWTNYYLEALEPSMARGFARQGAAASDLDDLMSELRMRVWRELESKTSRGESITPGSLFLWASRKRRDVFADHRRTSQRDPGGDSIHPSEENAEGIDVHDESTPSVEDVAVEREGLAQYVAAKETVLSPDHGRYAGKDPNLPTYDRNLVERWEADPDRSLRELGRELKQLLADTPLADRDETFACHRMSEFIQSIRRTRRA